MDKANIYVLPEEGQFTAPRFDMSFSHDAGEDFSLPDYIPEVRRVISVSAKALPETKFISGNTAELGGTLTFSVLYLGDDGKISCVPLACDYNANTVIPPETGYVFSDTKAETVSCRVAGPRRLSLKSRLRTRLVSDEIVTLQRKVTDTEGNRINASDELSLERLNRDIISMSRGSGSTTGKVSGEMRERADFVPIYCDGAINIMETRTGKDSIHTRGEAVIRCIFADSEGNTSVSEIKLPFDEVIDADGAEEGDLSRAWGRSASITVTPSEDGTGVIECTMEFDLEGEWMRKEVSVVTEDIYSTIYDTVATFAEREVLSPVKCATAPLSVGGSFTRQSTGQGRLVDIFADASAERMELTGNRLTVNGSCSIKAIVAGDDEITTEEYTLPFRYETDTVSDGEGELQWRCDAAVTGVSGRLDSDKLTANLDLCLSIGAACKNRVRYITETKIDKARPASASASQIKVYYPEHGEPIWEIAKRYRANKRRLYTLNSLPSDTVYSDGKPLIII